MSDHCPYCGELLPMKRYARHVAEKHDPDYLRSTYGCSLCGQSKAACDAEGTCPNSKTQRAVEDAA